MRPLFLLVLLGAGCSPTPSPVPPPAEVQPAQQTARQRPRLVLQIVVDQLRPDLLERAAHGFGDGGFNRLLRGGLVYRNAHNRQATTLTAAAHATIGTGAHSREHGIVGNEWFDRELQQQIPSVRDGDVRMTGEDRIGKSPFRLMATTLGDELARATAGQAKVFGISPKDRSAILITGKAGKAYWYAYHSGAFVSSTYYFDAYPPWVTDWNAAHPIAAYQQATWTLQRPIEEYASTDDRPAEGRPYGLGNTFPKALDDIPPAQLANSVRHTPFLDEHTVSFAIELIDHEQLGRDDVPDLLSISISSTDFIGHHFGPMSLEQEDNLIRLDATLSRLFGHLEQRGILAQTLVVLTADHGVDPIPETRDPTAFPQGRATPEVFVPALNEQLKQQFRAGDLDLVRAVDRFRTPYIYLNLGNLERLGLAADEVESAARVFVEAQPGIAHAYPRHAILAQTLGDDPFAQQVYRSYNPQRSGDLHLVAERHWYLNNRSDENRASHGSPHPYDTGVPLLVYGPGVEPKTVERPVGLSDIAPTLARVLSIPPPSHATGTPLVEVVGSNG